MKNSLVLIENSKNKAIGIGFVIYKNKNYKYILTSASLVEYNPMTIIVDSQIKVKIIYQGSSSGLNLAILKANVKNPSLLLGENNHSNLEIEAFKYDSKFESISYQLNNKENLRTNDDIYISGWRLSSSNIAEGSPIICKESGKVIAVMSQKQNFAISIENLRTLGRQIPKNLIESTNYIPKIFISLAHKEPDIRISKKISQELKKLGYKTFLATTDIDAGENWIDRLSKELDDCDYFILLLSKHSIESEMVVKEVDTIKNLQNEFGSPEILPIRINLSYTFNTKYELLKQIDHINQLFWEKEEDTKDIITALDMVISKKEPIPNTVRDLTPLINTISHSKKTVFLEQPTGIVPLESENYIKRYDDDRCYENLLDRYSLIRIKAPHKYGKSSLLVRLIAHAKDNGYNIISLNFREFNKFELTNLDELLTSICEEISEELNIEVTLTKRTLEKASAQTKATKYINKILSLLEKPLVISIDEADKLFEYKEVSDNFFGLIRAWHEKSKVHKNWENLKIILAHSTEPLLGLTTIDKSPFDNVGLGVELSAFTKEETEELALKYGINFDESDLTKLFNFIGGHPLLTRKVLYTIVKEKKSLDNIIKNDLCRKNIFYDHLRSYLWVIEKNQKLKWFLIDILERKIPYDDISSYILEATGIIIRRHNRVDFTCELYRNYFKEHLRRE